MKKKVLFALIALFSFVSAWAIPAPTTDVSVKNSSGNAVYTATLEGVASLPILAGEGGTLTIPTLTKVTTAAGTTNLLKEGATTKLLAADRKTEVSSLEECKNYFIQATITENDKDKTIYVPFYTGKLVDYDLVWNAKTWNDSHATGRGFAVYHEKYTWMDLVKETVNGANIEWLYEYFADKAAYEAALEADPTAVYEHRWESITKETTGNLIKGYPVIAFAAPANAARVRYIYNKENVDHSGEEIDAWGGAIFGPGEGQSKCGQVSIHNEPIDPAFPNAADLAEMTTEQADAAIAEFKSNFVMYWIPAEDPTTALMDYTWTLDPNGVDYDATKNWATLPEGVPSIKVYGVGQAGVEEVNPVGGNINEEAVGKYQVTFFTDYNCTNSTETVTNAGTYYVCVDIIGGVLTGDGGCAYVDPDKTIELDSKMFVVKRKKLTLTLLQLEKNYLDPDPEFVDVNGTWMYRNVNGEMQSFYTLKNAAGQEVNPSEIRLTGVRFKRIKLGEDVYVTENGQKSFAEYPYTVYLSEIRAITPATTWANVDLDDPTTFSEGYEVVLGHNDVLMISPRDLSKLDLTVDPVYHDGTDWTFAKLNAANKVRGLQFMPFGSTDPDDAIAVTGYSEEPAAGAENKNVTRNATTDAVEAEKSAVILTAAEKSNFIGSKLVKFTIMPRPIDKKIPVWATNADGSVKLGENNLPEQDKNADNTPKTIDNNLGAWDFKAYADNLPIYSGSALIPEALTTATCAGLQSEDKTMALFNAGTKKGDYTITEYGEGVDYVNANVKQSQNKWVARPQETFTEGAWVPADPAADMAKAKVLVTGKGNFCGERDVEYAIYPKNIMTSGDITYEIGETTYSGEVQLPTVKVTDTSRGENGTVLTNVQDYTVAAETGASATASSNNIVITGYGNYTGSQRKGYTNNGAVLEIALTTESKSKTYGDEDPDFEFEVVAETAPAIWTNTDQWNWVTVDNVKQIEKDAKGNNVHSALYNDLMEAITFSREPGETVVESPYKFSYTVDATKLTPKKDAEEKVIPNQFVYGNYTVVITGFVPAVEATATAEAKPAVAPEFVIEKAPLTVTALDQTRNYDPATLNAETDWTTDGYQITGWATGTLTENGISYTFADDEASVITAKGAQIVVTPYIDKFANVPATSFTVKKGYVLRPSVDPASTVLDNYVFNFVAGTLDVNEASLIVKAVDKSKTYGATDPDLEFTITGWLNGDQWKKNADGKYVDDSNNVLADQNDETKRVHSVAYTNLEHEIIINREDGENVGTYEIFFGQEVEGEVVETVVTGKPNTSGNYNVEYVEGTFEIKKAQLTVTAIEQTLDYGENINTNIVVGTEAPATVKVEGLQNGDQPSDLTITLSRLDNPANTAVGTYDPATNGKTAGIKVEVAPKDNYTIECIYGKVIIAKGNAEIALVRPYLGSTALWGEDGVQKEGAEIFFAETDDKGKTTYTATAKYGEAGKAQKQGANKDSKVKNSAAQYIADYDGQTVNVTFGNYAIIAGQWEALVLPFDIDMETLSPLFGYALVNVVDVANSTSDNLAFKKEMYTIPANTPFLVKASKNTNLAGIHLQDVKFVNPESADDLTVVAAGNKFIGTYAGYWNADARADGVKRAQFQGGVFYDGWDKATDEHLGVSTLYAFPLGAYFEFNATASAGVRITVEDENGVTTEINAVEIAGAETAAEGWYTITGVKLEGKPATKGTYIYNGKVVYVK